MLEMRFPFRDAVPQFSRTTNIFVVIGVVLNFNVRVHS